MTDDNFPVEVPVRFATQSSNKESASIGVSISRDHADVTQVEQFFCAKRLSVELQLGEKNPTKHLPGMKGDAPQVIVGVFDAKTYGAKSKEFTTRLTGSTDMAAKLSQFAGRTGTLTITGLDAIPEKHRGNGAANQVEEPPALDDTTTEPTVAADDPELLPIADLANYGVPAKQCTIVAQFIVKNGKEGTIGGLLDWLEMPGTKIEDIPKLGHNGILRLKEAISAWEEAHPIPQAM